MNFNIKRLWILLAISVLTFVFSNYLINGSLSSTFNLGRELKSPPDSLYQWGIANEAPFKYRVLHRAIVMETYHLVAGGLEDNLLFFTVYRGYAFIFHTLAIFLFYFFLRNISLEQGALAGTIVFSLLPAFLMAYNMPVHTREDMLAYSLLILGLYSIHKNHIFFLLLFSILGVLCRETLLVVPFVNLFFNTKQHLTRRFLIASAAFGVLLILRFTYGLSQYDYLEGFKWNVDNMEQVIGFSYITFGVLWIPFLASMLGTKPSNSIDLLYRSSTSVFLLIMITTFMGGIFNEIRILYLLAPWVIPIGLNYYFIHREEVKVFFQSKIYLFSIGLLLVVLASGMAFAIKNVSDYIEPSRYAISYKPWIIISVVQLYFGIIFMPIFIGIKMKKRIS